LTCFGLRSAKRRSEHEAADGDEILGDEEVGGQHDKVEADKEEDRRRQHFAKFV
jgi:hypothetical protein